MFVNSLPVNVEAMFLAVEDKDADIAQRTYIHKLPRWISEESFHDCAIEQQLGSSKKQPPEKKRNCHVLSTDSIRAPAHQKVLTKNRRNGSIGASCK